MAKRKKPFWQSFDAFVEDRIQKALRRGATGLDLSHLRLTALPESLGKLTRLRILDLSGNRFTALPEWLSQMTQLRQLKLSYSEPTAVLGWLGQLSQLQELDVSNSRLTALPRFVRDLKRLQRLDLSVNRLTELPAWLSELSELQYLNLSRNQLKTLPESLGQLKRVQILYLSRNQLIALPECLGQLTQLQRLRLSGNSLASLPDWIRQLTELQYLDLSGNKLRLLPESLRRIPSLSQLYLHGNKALGLPARVLGPSWEDVINRKAVPAKSGEILEYYFQKRRGSRRLKDAKQAEADHVALRVFISYSHKDETLRKRLETHLKLLQRQGLISVWSDRKITAGEEWKGKIDENLESASIILLLVSPDFVASDYCFDQEMKRALARHEARTARVIPIILRAVDWPSAPFAKLEALPKDAKPVSLWRDRDSAWNDVVAGIREVARRLVPKSHRAARDEL
jgi:hypothetical protein